MDLHDVGRDRGDLSNVLATINAKTLCVGISSDVLYPAEEQRGLAELIPDAQYAEIHSVHGHDAFLMEYDQLTRILNGFLDRT